ncbi:hypothetical protein Tco_1253903 [Tanacetum coccineum]
MRRITGQREVRPVWNNAQRVNHQNKLTHPHPKRNFVPTAVLTKSGNVPVKTGSGPQWLFDIDSLTKSMNYEPVTAGNQTNDDVEDKDVILNQAKEMKVLINLNINTVSSNDPSNASLEETGIFDGAYDDEDVGVEADINNLETIINVSPIPTTIIHKDHPKYQIIGDLNLSTQTRRMINFSEENAMVSYINKQRRTNHKHYQNCLFAYFLSQQELKKVIQSFDNSNLIKAMQEDFCNLNFQRFGFLVILPKARGLLDFTKCLYRNKKERERKCRTDVNPVSAGYVDDIILGATKKSLCDEFVWISQKIPEMISLRVAHFLFRIASTTEGGWNLY